jgi:hypothetical protein
MGHKLGIEGVLYYLSGTNARVAWSGTGQAGLTALGNTKDVTLNLEKGEADTTTRTNNGWKATVGTLKEASIEWEMVWDTDDAGFTAMQTAWLNDTNIALAVLDGAHNVTGSQGLWADCQIISFSRSEPLEEAMSVKVTAKPAYSALAPEWAKVTGGT